MLYMHTELDKQRKYFTNIRCCCCFIKFIKNTDFMKHLRLVTFYLSYFKLVSSLVCDYHCHFLKIDKRSYLCDSVSVKYPECYELSTRNLSWLHFDTICANSSIFVETNMVHNIEQGTFDLNVHLFNLVHGFKNVDIGMQKFSEWLKRSNLFFLLQRQGFSCWMALMHKWDVKMILVYTWYIFCVH